METRKLIESYYDRFNSGDFNGMISLLDPAVDHEVNQGETEAGIDRFRDFLERMADQYKEQIHDIVVMISPDGSRAACEYKVTGTYLKAAPGLPPAQGQKYTIPGGAFFTVKGGKISRVTNYYNAQKWVEIVSGKASTARS